MGRIFKDFWPEQSQKILALFWTDWKYKRDMQSECISDGS